MQVRTLNSKDQNEFGIENGVVIDNVGEYFEGQIERGSLIIDINGERIYTIEDLERYSPQSVEWITYITPAGDKIRLRL